MFNTGMSMTLKKIAVSLCVCMVLLGTYASAADEERLLGEGNDGNRSTPVHLFKLLDENGMQIRASDKKPKPFSIRKTCGECHDYDKIAGGWHFNGHDPEVEAGRPGQPWVLTDSVTRTQIPITARKWEGTYAPEELGIDSWEFLQRFYSHFPGGSYGEMEPDDPHAMIRQEISGKYEINCLACHHADFREDQSLAALQSARQNFRWIPTASSGKAVVSGVAMGLSDFFDPEFDDGISVAYNNWVFDSDNMVFFDITKGTNNRCDFCHSNQDLRVSEDREWTRDVDVHIASGMNCTDCHRNGDDHMITRGIETEGRGKYLTCEGCHLGDHADIPQEGSLGAPKPLHRGIPPIHFEKLTCTACHSGTWPTEDAGRWKTARMHKTGLHGKHHLDIPQPHVYAPVLMKGEDGKIGTYKMFWPSFWASLDGETISPIAPKAVLAAARTVLSAEVERVDDWRPLTEEQIRDVLSALKKDDTVPVYIAGGRLYQLDAQGALVSAAHDAARPYAWAMAHDVRPAEQSLGVRNCADCHTTDSPFFFGKVEIDTPVKTANGLEYAEMIELQGINRLYMWAFNFSFVFRPMLKVVAFASCALIGMVVLAYVLKAIAAVSNACAEEGE